MISLKVNGTRYDLDVAPDTPLLWVIRDTIGLTGTKFGCGMALCGACTVHVNGEAVRSCVASVSSAAGAEITTIEGIPDDHPVKRAWVREQVPQCGYCQPGQIMQAIALLSENPNLTDEEILNVMDGNLCRCGTYPYIKRAIRRASQEVGRR